MNGPWRSNGAVVRHDADLTYVTLMRRDAMPGDGTLAALPASDAVPQSRMCGTSVFGDGLMPTVHFRRDRYEFQAPFVADLFNALRDPRIGEGWEILPTPLGNLALIRLDPVGDRWYAGYIELMTGEVVLYDGDPEPLQRLADNYPFHGPMRYVDGLSHDETLRELRGR